MSIAFPPRDALLAGRQAAKPRLRIHRNIVSQLVQTRGASSGAWSTILSIQSILAWAPATLSLAAASVSPVMFVVPCLWMAIFIFVILVSILGKPRHSKRALAVLSVVYGRRPESRDSA